eukprot:gnl/Hemi2/27648_TR9137_c0_g1_i1.p1 gnl/Hemi2/27648_TR9137_c0_g1~~gnl/Hemi2/27648_TR9137_c0_g1_i1.p1  ORF type:complete len:192 (+),score=42.94 gnl/Hemi2/27648_TR9137_c0_g1_i1:82-657(+)
MGVTAWTVLLLLAAVAAVLQCGVHADAAPFLALPVPLAREHELALLSLAAKSGTSSRTGTTTRGPGEQCAPSVGLKCDDPNEQCCSRFPKAWEGNCFKEACSLTHKYGLQYTWEYHTAKLYKVSESQFMQNRGQYENEAFDPLNRNEQYKWHDDRSTTTFNFGKQGTNKGQVTKPDERPPYLMFEPLILYK